MGASQPGKDHALPVEQGVPVVIEQQVNFRILIQRCLERFVEERSQHKLVRAATQLVSLHGLTSELIELDPAFAEEWEEIRGGRLVDWIRNNPVELSWRDLDLGFEAFVRLLGRFRMGLRAELSDPLDVDLDALRREGHFMARTRSGGEESDAA